MNLVVAEDTASVDAFASKEAWLGKRLAQYFGIHISDCQRQEFVTTSDVASQIKILFI